MFGASNTPFGSSGAGGGFGQPTNTAPTFGSPAPAPTGLFGAPAPAPPVFGATAPGAFGSAFGAPAPAATGGMFGSSTGSLGFGSAPTSTFGATPAFGAPAQSTGLFGAAPSTGLFGSPPPATPFGATSSNTNAFGAPSTSTFTGGFGSTTASNTAPGAFGAPAPGGLFGAPAPFGAPTSTSTFGAPSSTTTPTFGAPAPSTSLFGAPPAASGGFAFGAMQQPTGAAAAGTRLSPYQVTSRPDGTSSINLQAITAMPAYEKKSFEELRYEDYSMGNRGSSTPTASNTTGSAFGFGAPAPAPGGLFGSTAGASGTFGAPAPITFGAPAPSAFGGFGTPAPAPTFGSPAPAFGAPAPAGGGLFGAPVPAPFGSTTTSTFGAPAGGGLFGSPAPATSLFGAPAPTPFGAPAPFGSTSTSTTSGGLFSRPSAPAPASFGANLFGAPTSALAPFGSATGGGGLFGSTAPAPSMFGAPAPASGGLFGAPPAPGGFGFGAAKPPGTGLFGSPTPAPSGFGFGNSTGLFSAPSPAPLFGAPPAPQTTSLFGAPAPSNMSLFGGGFGAAPAPSMSGLFGSAPVSMMNPLGGGFGTAAPTTLFGAPAAATTMMAQPMPTAPVAIPAPPEFLALQLRALEHQKKELDQMQMWRNGGNSTTPKSGVGATTPTGLSELDAAALPMMQVRSSFFSSNGGNSMTHPRSAVRIRPRAFAPADSVPLLTTTPTTTTPMRDNRGIMSPAAHVRSSALRLVVNPDSIKRSNFRLRLSGAAIGNNSNSTSTPAAADGTKFIDAAASSPASNASPSLQMGPSIASPLTGQETLTPLPVESPHPSNSSESLGGSPSPVTMTAATASVGALSAANDFQQSPGLEYYQNVIGATASSANRSSSGSTPVVVGLSPPPSATKVASPYVPTLTKPGYEMIPSHEELLLMSEADLAAVPGFTVHRDGYGTIEWEGAVDVRGADIDRIVTIEHQDVSVYVLDEEAGTKPIVGSKLNRPALITFYNVFPRVGGAAASDEEKDRFADRVVRGTQRMGAEFRNYDRHTGVWKIRVEHFSRYSLIEKDDEDGGDDTSSDLPIQQPDDALHGNNVSTNVATTSSRSRVKKSVAFAVDLPSSLLVAATSTPKSGLSTIPRKGTPHYKKDSRFSRDQGQMDHGFVDTSVTTVEDSNQVDYGGVYSSDDELRRKADAALEAIKAYESSAMELDEDELRIIETENEPDAEEEIDYISSDPLIVRRPIRPLTTMFAQAAALCSSGNSITKQLANKEQIKFTHVDSGKTLGRTFRVGWHPDGSFFKIETSASIGFSPVLVKCRPRFTNTSSKSYLSLLETQQLFSIKNDQVGEPPLYSLPRSTQDARSLFQALDEFADAAVLSNEEVGHSFKLLSYLLPDSPEDASEVADNILLSSRNRRVTSAILKGLQGLCATQVESEIQSAKVKRNIHDAVLAALSGGNIERACQIATDAGQFHLALILSTGLTCKKDDLWKQLSDLSNRGINMDSRFPLPCKRILKATAGDESLENDLFRSNASHYSWRYRLTSRFMQDPNKSAQEILREYENDMNAGAVPVPATSHVVSGDRSQQVQSLFYKLLHYMTDPVESSILDVIDPRGFTSSFHDLSFSFHLVSAIGATRRITLSSWEAEYLQSGYEMQLIQEGHWEWAVFVALCTITTDKVSPLTQQFKINRARNIVLRHFQWGDSCSQKRKEFLIRKLGVPSRWFDEASAYRSIQTGNAYDFVANNLKVDPNLAWSAMEQLLVPKLFYQSNHIRILKPIIQDAAAGRYSICRALNTFFELNERVLALKNKNQDAIEMEFSEIAAMYEFVRDSLILFKTSVPHQDVFVSLFPSVPTKHVPISIMVSDALGYMALLKKRLDIIATSVLSKNDSIMVE